MKTKTTTLPTGMFARFNLAAAGLALALFVVPHVAHGQGVIGGMERGGNQGSREGGRAAGPVGAVVGGAIGAGVGGAVGGVRGVLGISDRGPHRGHRCRGYHRHGHFYCYR